MSIKFQKPFFSSKVKVPGIKTPSQPAISELFEYLFNLFPTKTIYWNSEKFWVLQLSCASRKLYDFGVFFITAKCLISVLQYCRKFRHLAYLHFECFCSRSTFVKVFKVKHRKPKISRSFADSSATTSKLLKFVVSLTLWPLRYYILTNNSVWVAINIIFHFYWNFKV